MVDNRAEGRRANLLIVGLWPNPRHQGSAALDSRSGERLCELGGLRPPLHRWCDTTNLYSVEPKLVSFRETGERVTELITRGPELGYDRVVFLGAVARAGHHLVEHEGTDFLICETLRWYQVLSRQPHEWLDDVPDRSLDLPLRFAFSPHPSGVSRWWNLPEHVREAKLFWQDVLESSSP